MLNQHLKQWWRGGLWIILSTLSIHGQRSIFSKRKLCCHTSRYRRSYWTINSSALCHRKTHLMFVWKQLSVWVPPPIFIYHCWSVCFVSDSVHWSCNLYISQAGINKVSVFILSSYYICSRFISRNGMKWGRRWWLHWQSPSAVIVCLLPHNLTTCINGSYFHLVMRLFPALGWYTKDQKQNPNRCDWSTQLKWPLDAPAAAVQEQAASKQKAEAAVLVTGCRKKACLCCKIFLIVFGLSESCRLHCILHI